MLPMHQRPLQKICNLGQRSSLSGKTDLGLVWKRRLISFGNSWSQTSPVPAPHARLTWHKSWYTSTCIFKWSKTHSKANRKPSPEDAYPTCEKTTNQPMTDLGCYILPLLGTLKIYPLQSQWRVENRTRFNQNHAGSGNKLAVLL